MLLTVLVFLVILTILVLIHEAGHFFVAKKLGIKVEEFGFGFPPRAFGIKKGETVYSINWLPIGGFVKLYGEDEAGGGSLKIKDDPFDKLRTGRLKIKDTQRAFFARPVWQRASVVVAGVVMNATLAVLIFYIFLSISQFKTEVPLLGDHKFFGVTQKNVSDVILSSVVKNSPAEKAGLKPGMKVKSVNNDAIEDTKQFIGKINSNKGKEIVMVVEDIASTGQKIIKITPRVSVPKGQGALGVSFFTSTVAKLSYETPVEKIFSGITHPLNLLTYNFDAIGYLVKISLKEKTAAPLSEGVAGPIGIGFYVGNVLQIPELTERILGLLNLAGILSISLAFFNILPIPALDGGRLFFILVEGITGKKVNPRIETMAHTVGFALLLGLILLITLQDVNRFILPFFSQILGK
ncbi:MAG: site-2 protease family protein [Candidatus Levybacteria bacterium]|nr:site-2 protease family protein [Candidatus Levybacteria bacterium]